MAVNFSIKPSVKINFASDNYAGVHPSVLAALARANEGPEPAYGSDSFHPLLPTKFLNRNLVLLANLFLFGMALLQMSLG